MTDRERWTVYPLLFLALGIALEDKVTKTVNIEQVAAAKVTAETVACENLRSKNVICDAMLITDEQGHQRIVMSTNKGGGILRATGHGDLDVVLGQTEQLAGLMFVDDKGNVKRGSVVVPTHLRSRRRGSPGEANQPAPSEPAAADADAEEAAPAEVPAPEDANPPAPGGANEGETAADETAEP